MKTVYLRRKRTGNCELSNKQNATHQFNSKKELKKFFESYDCKQVIKTIYRLSQTYFSTFDEFYFHINKLQKS